MDQVHKVHNFSAIIRSCDAVGVLEAHAVPPAEGLELSHSASAGAKKWVSVHRHSDVTSAIHRLQGDGHQVLATHPAPEALDFREVDFTRPTAILVGAELHGVSDEALAAADRTVVIPMMGMVQSLNVSVATALMLFEAQRQREAAGMYSENRIPPDEFTEKLFEWAFPRFARLCREAKAPYPRVSEDGEILDPLPGTAAFRNR